MKQIWEYKGKPYSIVQESKIKLNGKWEPVVIYKCEYENEEGMVWVRETKEFYTLFKKHNEK